MKTIFKCLSKVPGKMYLKAFLKFRKKKKKSCWKMKSALERGIVKGTYVIERKTLVLLCGEKCTLSHKPVISTPLGSTLFFKS